MNITEEWIRLKKLNEELSKIFDEIVKQDNALEDPNFKETPHRVSKMFDEFIKSDEQIQRKVVEALSKSFPSSYEGMIILTGIEVISMCPHHLLPVNYVVDVGYIPNQQTVESTLVIGASKLARIVEALASKAVLQEDFTDQIVSLLFKHLNPEGVACIVSGKHSCITTRGAKQPNSNFITSRMVGAFKDNLATRDEFLFHVKNSRGN